jgi:hypothetical protein
MAKKTRCVKKVEAISEHKDNRIRFVWENPSGLDVDREIKEAEIDSLKDMTEHSLKLTYALLREEGIPTNKFTTQKKEAESLRSLGLELVDWDSELKGFKKDADELEIIYISRLMKIQALALCALKEKTSKADIANKVSP